MATKWSTMDTALVNLRESDDVSSCINGTHSQGKQGGYVTPIINLKVLMQVQIQMFSLWQFYLLYGSGHKTAAVLLPGFAINW